MASALMAFVQGLQANENAEAAPATKPTPKVAEDDLFVDSEEEEDSEATTAPANPPPKLTLVDVAREQAAVNPLVAIAAGEKRNQAPPAEKLAALAAQINAEEASAANKRSAEIQQSLAATSVAVVKEAQQARAQQVAAVLQQAAAEEPQYEQEDDAFEDEDAIQTAATALVVQLDAKKNSLAPKQKQRPKSVDRDVLKKRHGLTSHSVGKAATMKDKLSRFQWDQLSVMQRRVFLATLVDSSSSKPPRRASNQDALDQLAKPKSRNTQRKSFARLDDVRNCRFKPRVNNSGIAAPKGHGSEDDDGEKNNQKHEDFVRRMEAAERARNEQIRRTREEAVYMTRVDKKECPQCGNPQSYAELTQKRKKCPNCGVTYQPRVAWSDISEDFLDRMAPRQPQKPSPQPQVEDRAPLQPNGRRKKQPPSWDAVQDLFLGRVQMDMERREETKDRVMEEMFRDCSFAPVITRKAQQLTLGDFNDRLRRDLEKRRQRREQNNLVNSRGSTPRSPSHRSKRTR